MSRKSIEDNLEEEYHISAIIIIYKFILGVIELLLAFGLVFGGRQMLDLYLYIRYEELLENSHETIAFVLEKTIPYLFEHQAYIVFLLASIGLAKIFGSIGLWQRKHWGLDLLVAVTLILLPVDTVNLIRHPTPSEFAFFIINILIALYLVNFNPSHYFTHLKKRTKFRYR